MEILKIFIQSLLNKFGYHLSQRQKNVSLSDPYSEQQRLLSNKKVKIIFDIGAADGRTSEHYHQLFPNATIYAFEPLPKSFQKLKDFASDKKYIIPINKALSDKEGEVEFHITALDDASSLLKPQKTGSSFDRHVELDSKIKVKTTTLDVICATYNIEKIDILKLDAQGAEILVFNGAKNLLDNHLIELIYSEINFIHIYDEMALLHEITTLLETNDYKLFNLFNLVHNQSGQISWGDAIFIKSKP